MNLGNKRGKIILDIMKEKEYEEGITLRNIYKEVLEHVEYNKLFAEANKKNREQWKSSIRALLQHQSINMKHRQGKHERFLFLGSSKYSYVGNNNKAVIDAIKAIEKVTLDIKEVEKLPNLTDKEKVIVIKQRLNQGYFRKMLLKEFDETCALKNINDKKLLLASHIVDYSDCDEEVDKANPFNGLLLSPDMDKLFDRKYISFDENGNLMIIGNDISSNMKIMGLEKDFKIDDKFLTDSRIEYLKRRNKIYFT